MDGMKKDCLGSAPVGGVGTEIRCDPSAVGLRLTATFDYYFLLALGKT